MPLGLAPLAERGSDAPDPAVFSVVARGAEALIDALPPVTALLDDRACNLRWFRQALAERSTIPRIPPQRSRKIQHAYDVARYRLRSKIENMFARLKDWRRIHTPYDRCADTFLAAVTLVAIAIFWINES